jgi:mersacidin/lichenicidin family type 2 lantibiotic
MPNHKTIRAWKDPEYRASLSAEGLASLPENPAGLIELTDADLGDVSGAAIARPKPRTPLCPTAPRTSVETGCTVTASYLPC